jgi:hypothetical protein
MKNNSKPMESFTFQTLDAYSAYQAIMAARAGVVSSEFLLSQLLRLHARQLQLQAVQDLRACRKII